MLVTSGFNFEGYRITRYLGFFSGETALGTGAISEFFAGAADFFGTTSSKFADKLEKAKDYAIEELKKRAQRAGANAIIGLDVDYNMFMSNMIGVIANGTAVCVESVAAGSGQPETRPEVTSIPAVPEDLEARMRPVGLRIFDGEVALEMILYSGEAPLGVLAEASVQTAFGETCDLGRMEFINVAAEEGNGRLLVSGFARPERRVPSSAVSARVKILSCMDRSAAAQLRDLRSRYGPDAVCPFLEDEEGWRCVCGMRNPPQSESCALCGRLRASARNAGLTQSHVWEAQRLATASEILQYVSGLGLEDTSRVRRLLRDLEEAADVEKAYGNNRASALRALKEALAAAAEPERVACPSCGFECTRDYARARKKCPQCGSPLWKNG